MHRPRSDQGGRAALDVLATRTAGDPAFAPGARIAAAPDGTTSTFQMPVPHPETSAEARASLDRLRALLRTTLPDVEYAVSGEVARGSDYAAHHAQRLPWVVVSVSLATLLVMGVAFGSAVALVGVVIDLAAALAAPERTLTR